MRLLAEPDKTGTIDGRNGGYYMVEWDNGTYTALYPTMIEPEGGEQLKLAAKPFPPESFPSQQMSLNIPNYTTKYFVKDGDWFIGNAPTWEEAKALAEQMRAERPNAQAVTMTYDDEGWPRVTCPRCGREGCVEGGVCPRCQKKLARKPLEGQQEMEVPEITRWITYYGPDATDVGVRSFATREEAEAEVEKMKANGWTQAITLPRGFTRNGIPVREGKRGRPLGDPNNPYGVTEDFSHMRPDVEWRVVKWNQPPPRDGWFIETNAPGMTGVGGWGPFPTEQAALDYVNKKTQLGQRPLFNPRSTLPGSMADIYGQ